MRDIREINAALRLWGFFPEMGSFLPYWLPAGAVVRASIEDFWRREHQRHGYEIVYTPHIARAEVWEQSGHLERFKDKMFPPLTLGSEEYYLRPMNCPFHISIFKSAKRSYRDLPIRYAELGTVYRYISAGSFHEMLEDRGFTQDDAHIFCARRGAKEEVATALQLTVYFLKDVFAISNFNILLRLKPVSATGEDALWASAQQTLKDVLEEQSLPYVEAPGEGLFYGPKIDFEITDPFYQKNWICSTIQLDIALAEAFGLSYTADDGREEVPLIIHRTILGSLERFIGILVGRTGGHLPLWLSPVQVLLLPLGGSEFATNQLYAVSVKGALELNLSPINLRVKVLAEDMDIREAKKVAVGLKAPYVVAVGTRERVSGNLSVTQWFGTEYGKEPVDMTVQQLADALRAELRGR